MSAPGACLPLPKCSRRMAGQPERRRQKPSPTMTASLQAGFDGFALCVSWVALFGSLRESLCWKQGRNAIKPHLELSECERQPAVKELAWLVVLAERVAAWE